ncbi:MAG: hypothetical protein ABI413_15370 [Ktedonobacteraceae bacterium]
MIAPRPSSYNPMEINHEGAMHAVLALLHQKQVVRISRWDCEICGMIHMGAKPVECDSCGSLALDQQADIHCEMNSHW